ncbi:hypothetical protein H4Q26_013328 [Puccinia striiformis f. sp. tritici PST-130]|nr:hypothetical protein H4Q26_013328 [Puccinia striiformis f. sp. tritici PST-130]
MATAGGSYSFSLTTFSPSGKLVQIEHALAAVGQGTSSLGIKDDSIIEKVASICPNIGMVYSGMGPDYRVLVTRARKIAQAYWKVYGEYPPTRLLTQEIATVMQEATQSGGVRPFGVSLLIAGWDEHRGSTLYQVDPSGSFWPWKASAIGKNMVNAKTFLEKRYNEELSLEDAIHTAILTLKEGFEGQMTEKTIEIGVMVLSVWALIPFNRLIVRVRFLGSLLRPKLKTSWLSKILYFFLLILSCFYLPPFCSKYKIKHKISPFNIHIDSDLRMALSWTC